MVGQVGLFEKEEVKPVELRTTVRLGTKAAQVPLAKRRREAVAKLKPILDQLEGKDILVSWCGGARSHWWLSDLKLSRLHTQWGMTDRTPNIVALWGTKDAHVRIFTDQLINVRVQGSDTKPSYLIDFWNGFSEYPIDKHKPYGCESIHIKPVR